MMNAINTIKKNFKSNNNREFLTLEDLDVAAMEAMEDAVNKTWKRIAASSNTNILDRTFARLHLRGIEPLQLGSSIIFNSHNTEVKIGISVSVITVTFEKLAKVELGRRWDDGKRYVDWHMTGDERDALPFWVRKTMDMIIKIMM